MNARLAHGSEAWFQMAGTLMCEAAAAAGLPPGARVSLLERYTDGSEFAGGLVQGLRFDIADGKPSFRVGAGRNERADITVEVTASASRELNSLRSDDPRYQATMSKLQGSGALRLDGDMARLGNWFEAVHDRIVDRTA